MSRTNISSESPWEKQVGYSRAVKVGPHIFIAGTTATDKNGQIVGVNHPYAQAIQTLNNLTQAVIDAGGRLKDVVRTRIYLKNMSDWEKIAKAHHDFFREIKPVCTMVEVSAFVHADILVEIEAEAYLIS